MSTAKKRTKRKKNILHVTAHQTKWKRHTFELESKKANKLPFSFPFPPAPTSVASVSFRNFLAISISDPLRLLVHGLIFLLLASTLNLNCRKKIK